jgi:3-hydroxybutyryl-CoA dehydrogenase
VTVVDPSAEKRGALLPHARLALQGYRLEARADSVHAVADLSEVSWGDVDLVIECIPEVLAAKQALFAQLVALAPAAVLTSNSSSFPISAIAQNLVTQDRMLGLHFFMPANLIPLKQSACAVTCAAVPACLSWCAKTSLDFWPTVCSMRLRGRPLP